MAELQKSCFKACSVLSASVVAFLLWFSITARASMAATRTVQVGVILDLNSTLGYMVNNSLAFAVEDYNSVRMDTKIKINLTVRNISETDIVGAAGAAAALIGTEKVRAILGPQNSEQARYIVKLGEEYQVPVIWFPTSGPSLLPPPSPSSIYSHQGHNCFQFQAIAETIKALGWQSIVPIYEETEYGSLLVPCLANVLKDMGIQMANVTAIGSESEINSTLDTLNNTRTHVFLVHMSKNLGTKFILSAQEKEMMGEGYAWILTQELSSLTDPGVWVMRELYNNVRDISSFLGNFYDEFPLTRYMPGALGVKPMDSNETKELRQQKEQKERDFFKRFGIRLTVYGWWAYHTIETLAMALEKTGTDNSGKILRKEILTTNFIGSKSGLQFDLRGGQLNQSELQVYNVVGDRERIIGSWRPQNGLFQNHRKGGETSAKYQVEDPLWPGDTLDKPPKLRIGVPATNTFPEFVNVDVYDSSIVDRFDGFAINVFLKAVDVLPFRLTNYEFVALPNMTYDQILCSQMKAKDLDAIIGDITVVANRTKCVDFTFPYLDSSVAMVVRVKDASTSQVILIKPFDWLLWVILVGIFAIATAIIIVSLEINKTDERNRTNEMDDPNGGKRTNEIKEFRVNPFLVYKIDVMGINSSSKAAGWMVILTSFLFIFIVQVYTASLTSILTQGKMKEPLFMDENELKSSNLSVGYQKWSWVRGFLIEQIGFDPSQLRGLGSREEYDEALSNGTVDAVFDETPHLTVFLSQYKSRFMMTGPIHQTGGFAFAFQKKSGLVSHFSNAILNVSHDVETYRVLMAKSSLPTSIEDLQFQDQK